MIMLLAEQFQIMVISGRRSWAVGGAVTSIWRGNQKAQRKALKTSSAAQGPHCEYLASNPSSSIQS